MSSLQSHLSDVDADADADADTDCQQSLGSHDDHVTDSPGDSSFDHPPESFWVPKYSEQDWFYRNATVQRKTSKKLAFSGDSGHRCKSSRTSSKRKRNASLIAFPTTQKSRRADGNFRRHEVGLFRSRSEPVGKGAMQASEPGSPIVTCTGKVRSRKRGDGRNGLLKWFGNVLRNGFGKNRVSSKAGSSCGSSGSVGLKQV